ncbi:TrmB family transcriptional regulator [Candidatus Micrarchaeota archaeon]|nr:TrmB family transcriptional regulator [Candidatus Micrarchaeota archaeon]
MNQYEARAYHALYATNTSTAGELSEKAELPRPRVYDVLSSLQDKGFVVLQPGRPVRYAALPITEAVQTLCKQRKETASQEIEAIARIAGELNAKIKNARVADKFKTDENVWTLKGREAIYSKLGSMIASAQKQVMLVSTPQGMARKIKVHGGELEAAKSRGVDVRVVSHTAVPEAVKIGTFHKRGLPTRLVVADDQALVFLTEEKVHPDEEVGLWINNPHVASTFKQLVLEKK